MRSDGGFHNTYLALESRMRRQAEADGDVFLPSAMPDGPVDYIFICMEPSLGPWARSHVEAEAKVKAGFRNFLSSMEDFILHFCARRYLCDADERYHITDLAKGAMLVARAGEARIARYDRWYALLQEELALICRPTAKIVAVGNVVADYLGRRTSAPQFVGVIHYSSQAAAARKAGIVGYEREFAVFKNTISIGELLREAETTLIRAKVPTERRAETLSRLAKGTLSESRLQLMFNYRTAFESMSCHRENGRGAG